MSWTTRGSATALLGKEQSIDRERDAEPSRLEFRLPGFGFSRALPFASISMGPVRKESHTHVEFPGEVCNRAKPCPSLLGLGVRQKKLFGLKNLNIYALGVYADPAAVKRSLGSKYKGLGEEQLAGSQALLDDVAASTAFEKSLKLVISFSHLKRTQFLEALEERLEPRLKKENDLPSLKAFKGQFDDVHFAKGLDITFVQDGNVLITKIDGKKVGAITSPALCKSLFDIYLGAEPAAPEAKSTFRKELAKGLKA